MKLENCQYRVAGAGLSFQICLANAKPLDPDTGEGAGAAAVKKKPLLFLPINSDF